MRRIILKGVNPNHFPEITPVSDDQYSAVLAANEQLVISIPDDARYVIFNSDADFFVAYGESVNIPSDTPGFFSTSTEYNPGQRFIGDKQDIRIKSPSLAHIHLSFYA